ncbi:MAG: alpha-glucosidase/alpha-galactosidase, partial [Rhodobacteraceae bacterium]|nr:alpha-glucosidase/alpha-galactosidase [Paracoccaceae bacterium]
MTTVAIIGAGSTIFTKNIVGDILLRRDLRDATLRLMDIDPVRLEESELV